MDLFARTRNDSVLEGQSQRKRWLENEGRFRICAIQHNRWTTCITREIPISTQDLCRETYNSIRWIVHTCSYQQTKNPPTPHFQLKRLSYKHTNHKVQPLKTLELLDPTVQQLLDALLGRLNSRLRLRVELVRLASLERPLIIAIGSVRKLQLTLSHPFLRRR